MKTILLATAAAALCSGRSSVGVERLAALAPTVDAALQAAVPEGQRLATARLARVQSDMALAQAEVTLFRALGGGWRGGAQAR